MRKIALTAALFAATVSTAAIAADWVFMFATDQSNIFVDRTSIRQAGPYKRAWVQYDYFADPEVWKDLVLKEFDCAGGRSRFILITQYNNDGKSQTYNDPDQWTYATSETAGEATLNYVCFGTLP